VAERIDLTTPIPSAANWVVQSLNLARGMTASGGVITSVPATSRITVVLLAPNGQTFLWEWSGTTADTLIVALNKVNLTPPNTLNKRILDRLISDGVIFGTSTGTAD
jgi:hypothetical protein